MYLWGKKQSGYKALFELNIVLFSLPLNCIVLFLQLKVIIPDLCAENSFVKKGKDISLFSTDTLACNTEKNVNGRGSAGRRFYQEDRE